jgi:hypothetical protein
VVVVLCGGLLLLILLTVGPLAIGRPGPRAAASHATCLSDLPSWPALLADAGRPVVSPGVVEVHDLAALKPADAARLDGKRSLFRVVIDGPADRQGDREVYEVLPSGDAQGVLFLAAGQDADGVLLVDAGRGP